MEDAPLPSILTPKESIKESFEIKQDKQVYKLIIEIVEETLTIILSEVKDKFDEYEIKLYFEELKQINKAFSMLNSCQEFLEYIKALIKNNKLSIKKENENSISIEFIVEYLYKQNTIKIELRQKSINLQLVVKDMFKQLNTVNEKLKQFENNYAELKEENNNLKNENKNINDKLNNIQKIVENLQKEIISLKNENIIYKEKDKNINQEKKIISKNKIEISSSIIKENELNPLIEAIEKKMKLKIKNINKLYQATIDGGEPSDFHKKCDGIKNTLILYESKGNRRFGGFTSETWEKDNNEKFDKNCFLFSLDKKKFFYINNKKYFKIECGNAHGPSFLHYGTYCIELFGNAFKENSLRTVESIHPSIFNGENNILSEDGKYIGVPTKEYEVFEIKFN